MNPDTKPERPQEINISTKLNSPMSLTIEPKKILIKGKERKIFESLDIPLPKKDNQKDTPAYKVN